MHTRRRFVVTSATALLAASTPTFVRGQVANRASESSKDDLFSNANLGALRDGSFTQARLEALVGTLFMAFVDEGHVGYMRLREVRTYTPPTATAAHSSSSSARGLLGSIRVSEPSFSQFTLIFSNERPLATQGSYIVDHGTLGRFTLFLVPSASVSGEPRSTAYFSLPTQTAATRPIAK